MFKSMQRLLWLCCLLIGAGPASMQAADGHALLLDLKGAIGPASADYVHRGLEAARESGASLVILRIDTPGGLDLAMRDIIRDILAAPMPVVSYVAPGGARAASAGTYILYASHIAAMAPGTNLGAATPVQIGGVPEPGKTSPLGGDSKEPKTDKEDQAGHGDAMTRKVVNDAVAYIRGLAGMHGRNAEWAEQAVREGVSLHAEAALEQHVIDLIAQDVPALLTAIDGRIVNMSGDEVTLATAGLRVEALAPDWRNRLLAVITDPNIAYILMLIGIYGLFFEFYNPGFVLPGVAGAICLVLALFAFQVLPVNYAGVALILLGMAFMIGEAFVPSFGVLGIGGIAAFVFGSIILFDGGPESMAVSIPLIAGLALTSAVFFSGGLAMALRARKRPVVTGREEMIGAIGETLDGFTGRGRIRVHSEIWQASCDKPLHAGQAVRVIAMEGLVLRVEPVVEI